MGGTKQTANHIASDFGKILHRVTVMREPIECQIRRLHTFSSLRPQPHSRSPRSLPAAPFMFLGAHSAHFSRERGLSRSQGDVRYWSYLRALNPTSKTFGGREAEVHRLPLRGRPLFRPLLPTMRHWSEGIRGSIVAPHRRFQP